MQKWQADLWHSSISRKENEPAANIIWLLVHHYVILAATISLFSFPLIPPGVRHFTIEPTHRSISFSLRFSYRFFTIGIQFKGRKIICWVTWRHPAFLISRILPPKMLESPTLKAFGGGKATKSLYQAVNFFRVPIQRFSFIRFPLVRSHHPLSPVTRRDLPCCRFDLETGSERCTKKQVSRENRRVKKCAG